MERVSALHKITSEIELIDAEADQMVRQSRHLAFFLSSCKQPHDLLTVDVNVALSLASVTDGKRALALGQANRVWERGRVPVGRVYSGDNVLKLEEDDGNANQRWKPGGLLCMQAPPTWSKDSSREICFEKVHGNELQRISSIASVLEIVKSGYRVCYGSDTKEIIRLMLSLCSGVGWEKTIDWLDVHFHENESQEMIDKLQDDFMQLSMLCLIKVELEDPLSYFSLEAKTSKELRHLIWYDRCHVAIKKNECSFQSLTMKMQAHRDSFGSYSWVSVLGKGKLCKNWWFKYKKSIMAGAFQRNVRRQRARKQRELK